MYLGLNSLYPPMPRMNAKYHRNEIMPYRWEGMIFIRREI